MEKWSVELMLVRVDKNDGELMVRGGAPLDAETSVRGLDAARFLVYAIKIGDGDLGAHGFRRGRDGNYYWERFGVVMRVEEHPDHFWAQIRPAEQAAREPYTRPAGVMGEVRA